MHTRIYKDSGNITLTNSTTIISDGIYIFNVDDRFKPYEQIAVINNSDEDIGLSSNYKNDFKFIIPSGDQRIIDIVVEDLRIKNKGTTTINADEIIINIRHTGQREKTILKDKLETFSQIAMLTNFLR